MATRVKQLAAGVALLLTVGGLGAGAAGAQTAATASFASPVTVPALQPMWVRSITPCPIPTAGVASIVVARIVDEVTGGEVSANATAVRSDGHWDASVIAPAGALGDGTIGYLVEAQCLTRAQVPDAEPIVRQKYVLRPLTVTSGASGPSLGWLDGPVGGVATTTTSTTVAPTTTTTVASTTTSSTATTSSTTSTTATTVAVNQGASFDGADAIQAEIVKKAAIDAVRRAALASQDDFVALNASPASAARDQETRDGGIPAWSFACAAALAVGAVLAWGQRRSATVEIDQ
jgi:hypothetical protein